MGKHILQVADQRIRVLVPAVRILLHTLQDDLLQPDRDRRVVDAGRRDVVVHVSQRHRHRGIAGEGKLSGQHLVHGDAEGIDVAPLIREFPLRLFRGNIVDTAHGLGSAGSLGRYRAGNAEIRHLQVVVFRQNNVLRLDVAVDDAPRVGCLQAFRDLDREVHCFIGLQPALLVDIVLQGDALHQLHDDIVEVVFIDHVIIIHDIRMDQRAGCLRLHLELPDESIVRDKFLFQDLDRYIAVQFMTACPVNFGHAAAPDQVKDLIAVLEEYSRS